MNHLSPRSRGRFRSKADPHITWEEKSKQHLAEGLDTRHSSILFGDSHARSLASHFDNWLNFGIGGIKLKTFYGACTQFRVMPGRW